MCLLCGYNLRTLSREGQCPECGAAVGRSLHGDLLRYCDPDWLARIAKGLSLIVWMIIILLACVVLALEASMGGEGLLIVALIVIPVYMAAGFGLVVGTWLFTTPEPNRLGHASDLDVRRFIRATVCASVALMLVSDLMEDLPKVSTVLHDAGQVTFLCCTAGILAHIRRLARRIPSESLVNGARWLLVGFVLAIGLTVMSTALLFFTGSPSRFEIAQGIPVCLCFILIIAYLLLLDRLHRTIAETARQARQD